MKNKLKTCALFTALVSTLFAVEQAAVAGLLQDTLEQRMSLIDDQSVASLRQQAMQSRYKAARSARFPRISLAGTQAKRNQTVVATQDSLLRSGSDSFANTRYGAMIKQPLYDREISGQIDEAKSFGEYADIKVALERDEVGAAFLLTYLELAKNSELLASFDLMIRDIEREVEAANKKIELNLITSGELITIKLHLLNLKKNRDIALIAMERARSELTVNADSQYAIVKMNNSADFADLVEPLQSNWVSDNNQSASLKSEIALLSAQAKIEHAKRLPKVSLIGRYAFDDAAETVFGVPSQVEDYEFGVVFEWTLYRGGFSNHKLRELRLLKQAKQANLRSALTQLADNNASSSSLYKGSLSRLRLESEMMDYNFQVNAAMSKGLEVGTEGYLPTINSSLMVSESQRNVVTSKYAVLQAFIGLHLNAGTLFSQAVPQIDAMFGVGSF